MSLDGDTSSASTPSILNDYSFKSDLFAMMSDSGPETNDQLKHCAKAILWEMEPMLTSVHGVKTFGLLDAMIEGSEQAGSSSGLHYVAAAIIVAYKKGNESHSSASELTKLAEDWLLFFLCPSPAHGRKVKKPFRTNDSPQSDISTHTLCASEDIDDTVPTISQFSRFWDLISKHEGDKCALSGTLNTLKGPYSLIDDGEKEGYLEAVHFIPRPIIHEHSEDNLVVLQPTIDIIKHYANLPASLMDDVAGIIDTPENGMLLQLTPQAFLSLMSTHGVYTPQYGWILIMKFQILMPLEEHLA
ncbi:hypothetical protein BDR07DRAFT_1375716 [Suillus spraguei]|nr:hypothetical protein BDR07DRAFT_1375716 [Suillus spraguei]